MQRSEERILTTQVGSLPRNPTLADLLIRQERGETIDEAELDRQVEAAVKAVVHKQLEVVWAKLRACKEGARIASARLWGRESL